MLGVHVMARFVPTSDAHGRTVKASGQTQLLDGRSVPMASGLQTASAI